MPNETDFFNLENKIRLMISDLISPILKKTSEHDLLLTKLVKHDKKQKNKVQSLSENLDKQLIRLVPIEIFNKKTLDLTTDIKALDTVVNKKLETFQSNSNKLTHKYEYQKATLKALEDSQKFYEDKFNTTELSIREFKGNIGMEMSNLENIINKNNYEAFNVLENMSGKIEKMSFNFQELSEKTIHNFHFFLKQSTETNNKLEGKMSEVLKDRVGIKDVAEIKRKLESDILANKAKAMNEIKILQTYIDKSMKFDINLEIFEKFSNILDSKQLQKIIPNLESLVDDTAKIIEESTTNSSEYNQIPAATISQIIHQKKKFENCLNTCQEKIQAYEVERLKKIEMISLEKVSPLRIQITEKLEKKSVIDNQKVGGNQLLTTFKPDLLISDNNIEKDNREEEKYQRYSNKNVEKIESSVEKIRPPVEKIKSPVEKIKPPVEKIGSPVEKIGILVEKIGSPAEKGRSNVLKRSITIPKQRLNPSPEKNHSTVVRNLKVNERISTSREKINNSYLKLSETRDKMNTIKEDVSFEKNKKGINEGNNENERKNNEVDKDYSENINNERNSTGNSKSEENYTRKAKLEKSNLDGFLKNSIKSIKKSYFSEEAKEITETKERKETQKTKEMNDTKDKEVKEKKKRKKNREIKEIEEKKEITKITEITETIETTKLRKSKKTKETKKIKETKETRGAEGADEIKEKNDSKEEIDTKEQTNRASTIIEADSKMKPSENSVIIEKEEFSEISNSLNYIQKESINDLPEISSSTSRKSMSLSISSENLNPELQLEYKTSQSHRILKSERSSNNISSIDFQSNTRSNLSPRTLDPQKTPAIINYDYSQTIINTNKVISEASAQFTQYISNQSQELSDKISEFVSIEIENLQKARDESIATILESTKSAREKLAQEQEELRIHLAIIHDENKQMIKQRINDMLRVDSDFKKNAAAIEGHDKEIEHFKEEIMSIFEELEGIVESQKIIYSLLRQDEEDRDGIQLTAISENKQRSFTRPKISLKPECLSCSGQSSSVYSAFKMACLNYLPSEVNYNKRMYQRDVLINLLGEYINNIKDFSQFVNSINYSVLSMHHDDSFKKSKSKTPKISSRFLLSSTISRINPDTIVSPPLIRKY